MAAPCAGP